MKVLNLTESLEKAGVDLQEDINIKQLLKRIAIQKDREKWHEGE